MSLSMRLIALLSILAFAAVGCGEADSPTDNQSPVNQGDHDGSDDDDDNGDSEPVDPWEGYHPDFAAVGEVIQATCALGACHGNPTGDTTLSFSSSSAELIKETLQTYVSENGFPLITPGNPDESDLYLSLISEDENIRMPRTPLDPLDAETIEKVRSWIEAGAPYE